MQKILQASILAAPLLILNIKHMSEVVMVLLAISGIIYLIKDREFPVFNEQIKTYSYLFWFFFLSVVVSVIFSDNPTDGIRKIGSHSHFLFAPLIAYAIYKSNINFQKFILFIKIAIIAAGIFAIYEAHYLNSPRVEAGADASTIFGIIMVIFAFFSIVDIWEQGVPSKILSIAVFLLAIYSSILSGARISWVALIVLIPSVMFIWHLRGNLTAKRTSIILLLSIALVLFAVNNKQVSDRFSAGYSQFSQFSIESNAEGSVDLRLSMWYGGLKAFQASPIIGHGYQNTGIEASKHTNSSFSDQKMLHNDYINSMVGFGIVGLLSLLLLFFVPFFIFFKRLKNNENCSKNSMGLILVIGMMIFATTDSIYSHNVMRSFVVFFMAILLIKGEKIN